MFPMFDQNLVQNDILFEYGGSNDMQIFEFLILAVQMHGLYALLSYYLAKKWSLHIRSHGLEIPTLIGEK